MTRFIAYANALPVWLSPAGGPGDGPVATHRVAWTAGHTCVRLRKTLWAFTGNRIAVRFEYEWQDETGQWWRSHGNENWEFDDLGYIARRYASINDQPIEEADRKFRWERV